MIKLRFKKTQQEKEQTRDIMAYKRKDNIFINLLQYACTYLLKIFYLIIFDFFFNIWRINGVTESID